MEALTPQESFHSAVKIVVLVCFKAQKMASPAKKNSPVENQDKLAAGFADL